MTTLQEGRVLSGGDARGMAAAAVNAMSPNTLRSYRLHWSNSQDWTKARGLLELPARPQDQASFLAGLAEAGASLSAVKLAMLSAPLGHGVQAARAAQHGAHCHGQYGSQGMTNPPDAARVGYLGQGFPQSQRNLYLPVLPSPDLRIPKNNLIVDPRLTTVEQLNDPAPSPPPAVLTPSIGVLQWIRGKVGGPSNNSHTQVVKKLRSRLDAGDQQVVPGAGAGHIEQVSFSIVNFFQVCLVRN